MGVIVWLWSGGAVGETGWCVSAWVVGVVVWLWSGGAVVVVGRWCESVCIVGVVVWL